MRRLRVGLGTAAVGIALLVGAWSCSDDKPNQTAVFTELDWVGTSVVYHDAPGKRAHSVIFVMADWCGWCARLKTQTLADSTVIQILGESFNCVYLNPDADSSVVCGDSTLTCRQMTTMYDVRGYPAMLFFNRAGAFIGPAPGYKTVEEMVALLEMVRDPY